jgi:hypothetical protein
MNNSESQRHISNGCPQGSASGPGYLNILYNTLLNLRYGKNTKEFAYADDLVIVVKRSNPLEIENYANIETQMLAKYSRDNKMRFNEQKSKVMIITKKRPKNRREIKIFINKRILQQADTMNYRGITIDRRLNYNQHIDKITGKSMKIVHALSRTSKINWGLRHDVLRIIYTGAILPTLSYRAPVWIECLKKKHNAIKHKRVQRLMNIKMAKAYRTTSYEALCLLTGMTPILSELENQTKIYHNTRGN